MNELLTWVPGDRRPEELDEVSRKNLAGSRKPNAMPAGGGAGAYQFKQPDGSYAAGEEARQTGSGTSIFDPVLAELAYRWFSPPGGHVLDPFAGGSVRGIVASVLGRQYTGIDLRAEQIAANEPQAARICAGGIMPRWIVGDSRNAAALAPGPTIWCFRVRPTATWSFTATIRPTFPICRTSNSSRRTAR